MATDPNTGQSIVNAPRFDQQFAGFLDPSAFGGLEAQQGQLGQQSALAQQMMQAGYIPRSGFGGALAQMVQAAIGAHMLKQSQSQQASLYQQQIDAMNKAAQAKHAQDIEDERNKTKFGTDEEIRKAGGTDEAKTLNALKYGDQTAAQSAKQKGLEAQATLPAQEALEKMRGGYQLAAAQISSAPFKEIQAALKSGAITPEQAQQAMQQKAVPPSQIGVKDQVAIDKRIPVLQDQLTKVDTALQLAQEMKNKMHTGGYATNSLYNTYAPDALKTSAAQQLGTDSGNLILAAQAALQGSGSRGSVAQLRVLQTSKPNVSLSAESNLNAIDKITAELERAKQMPAAELDHYGSGGTPTTWAQASAKLSAPAQKQNALSDEDLLKKYGGQ
jgi:hypothetical protein